MMKNFCQEVLKDADRLIANVRDLDYRRIAEHDKDEVSKLHKILHELEVRSFKTASALDHIDDIAGVAVTTGDEIMIGLDEHEHEQSSSRHEEIIGELDEHGFDDRMNRVYDSFAEGRSCSIHDVPHRRGMPPFDTVVAADFSPVSGMHGIFISKLEVASAVLPHPAEDNEWKVLARKHYTDLDEMTEYVTLLSAGFELP